MVRLCFIKCVQLSTEIRTGIGPISVQMSLQLQSVRIHPGFSVRITDRLEAIGRLFVLPVRERRSRQLGPGLCNPCAKW